MNKFFGYTGVFIIAFLLIGRVSFAQTTFSDPISYNDYIVDNQDKIGVELLSFMDLFKEGVPAERFKEVHKSVLKTIDAAIKDVKGMPAYEGNLRLKDASVALFQFYKSVVETEYKELMDIYIDGVFNEETTKKMDALITSITDREANFDKEFAEAQAEFAKKHGFSLEENDLQKEFENDGE